MFLQASGKIFIQYFSTNKVLVPRCLFSVSAFSVRCAAMIFRAVQCYPASNFETWSCQAGQHELQPRFSGRGCRIGGWSTLQRNHWILGNFYRFLVYRSYCSFLHQLNDNQRAEWSNTDAWAFRQFRRLILMRSITDNATLKRDHLDTFRFMSCSRDNAGETGLGRQFHEPWI